MNRHKLIITLGALLSAAPFTWGQSVPIPGQWTLAYDWDCDGSYSTATMTLNSNGTFSESEGYTGVWVQQAGLLTFKFNNSNTTYSGNLASKSITGIQSTFGGLNGCFYMLQSGAPTLSSELTFEPSVRAEPKTAAKRADATGNQ
jgi:hypothetical protein